ncbi:ATP-binding cassette domain-containing protein [Janibacter sp. G56]|uniref:ABC transporter ATP-binding protein n=1 Tax=Janibacter sp. G56 TaxID=3418717 RepID=UPI003CFD79C8
MAAISIAGLIKTFGPTRAIDGLDLHVEHGEVHGFLGPNGSGKSTTLRILLGLLRADAGEVRLLGGDPWADAHDLHRRLAYVPGDVALWPNLTGGEVIDLLARMRGGVDAARRADLLERFELDRRERTRTYSKGNRQKVALVAALASDVPLLLLDEPTSSLDPLMERVFAGCIAEGVARGQTVLLSSHILSEVERLCERVTIIREGRTVETGAISELRHLGRTHVSATTSGPPPDLSRIAGVHDLVTDAHGIHCSVDGSALQPVMAALTAAGLTSLTTAPPTLEELFLGAYGEAAAAPAVP